VGGGVKGEIYREGGIRVEVNLGGRDMVREGVIYI
jgi:hypothetical protein